MTGNAFFSNAANMTGETPAHEPKSVESPRRGRWIVLSAIGIFLTVVAAIAFRSSTHDSSPTHDPIPLAAEISAMRIWLYNWPKAPKQFEVPANHYQRIRSAIAPTRPDRYPSKCIGMGRL